MSTKNQEQVELTTMAENIMVQFNESLKSQEQLNRQIVRRTSQIIRFGIFSIILIFLSIVFLAWSLKQDIGIMSDYMEVMARDASAMNKSAGRMQSSMRVMEGGINKIVQQTEFLSSPTARTDNSVAFLSNIANSVQAMQSDVGKFNKSIGDLNYNLNAINKQMKSLNRSLRVISQDVNRMPTPTNMFPF